MQKKSTDWRIVLGLLLIGVFVLWLNYLQYLQRPKMWILNSVTSVQKILRKPFQSLGDLLLTVQEIGDLKSKTEIIQSENQKLYSELSRLKEVERENKLLQKMWKFRDSACLREECFSLIYGQVVGYGVGDYRKSIVINLGSQDGVELGQAVVTDGGVMIGKIAEVLVDHSKVMLVLSADSSINVLTQTTRANGLVRGKYGVGLKLEMIEQGEELVVGDILITSSLEEKIPKGLIVGKISDIEQSPNAIFKNANVDLFVNFSHLESIFVVQKNDSNKSGS